MGMIFEKFSKNCEKNHFISCVTLVIVDGKKNTFLQCIKLGPGA